MKDTTKNTKTKARGGARTGAGRKSSGKKYYSYFLPTEIGDAISGKENPSAWVEEKLKDALEKISIQERVNEYRENLTDKPKLKIVSDAGNTKTGPYPQLIKPTENEY